MGKSSIPPVHLVLPCAVFEGVAFAIQGRVGLDLADEGFLWYGAQRVMLGEVPIRDFMAYDPGRYYWSAAVMALLHDRGLVALRIASAIFILIGVTLAAWLVGRTRPLRIAGVLMTAATLVLWMWPQFKSYDMTASIALVAALSWLLDAPGPRRCFGAGIVVGVAAIVGRNHGLYGAVAMLGAVVYLARGKAVRAPVALAAWSAGVVVGYSPLLVALTVVRGFARAFWESIRFLLFELKGTNLPLAIPWPWRAAVAQLPWDLSVHALAVGALFIAVPLFTIVSLTYALRAAAKGPCEPVFVAAVLHAVPYLHYSFSRADAAHLAFGVFPFLIGVTAAPPLLSSRARWLVSGTLLAISIAAMIPVQPAWAARRGGWRRVEVGGDTLTVSPDTAYALALLGTLADRYAPDGEPFLVAPYWPGAYAVFERKSPVWEIYPLFPRSRAFQEREIERIRADHPQFAILDDRALDWRDELRYRNTHPLIAEYIRRNYEPVRDVEARADIDVFKRQDAPR